MFIIETKGLAAARKASILMFVVLLLLGTSPAWLGALLTLHTYARPKTRRGK